MSAQEERPNLRRVFFADIADEQHRIAGGGKANKRAKLLRDFPGIAKVFKTPSGSLIEPSERISEERIRIEGKLNRDDSKSSDKRRHAMILGLLRRIAIGAELHQGGLGDEKLHATIGRAVIELIGIPLNHARREGRSRSANGSVIDEPWRNSVSNLKDDLMLALEKFDQIGQKQIAQSREGEMKLATMEFTLDCLARTLAMPAAEEVRARLEARGYKFTGSSQRNIDRQWNRFFKLWREVFLISE